jgi:asparagine synthase (glutamine-hydrolysing)
LRSRYFERRSPAREWDALSWQEWCADETLTDPQAYLEWRRYKAPPFLFTASDFVGWRSQLHAFDESADDLNSLTQAERIRQGIFPHYSTHWLDRGSPPDWHLNPFTSERAENKVHWSRVRDDGCGDIKHIWELSRFAWVYPLVRVYARDGNERHADTFWRLLEDWLDKNPPNRGVNWMCGQEVAIRIMAWCVGLYGFMATQSTTPQRMTRLALAMAESGRRIEANLAYALSQKNNHGITECTGLITIGLLFPEIRNAGRWRRVGLRYLEQQVNELFYPDGGFSQHSTNYARLALQALVWLSRLLARSPDEQVDWLQSAIARGSRFLFEICQPGTGDVPNSGGNDGALLMPWSNCHYGDFRPVIQAGMLSSKVKEAPFGGGPWDEELLWLGLTKPLDSGAGITPLAEFDAPDGGLFTLRRGNWTLVAKAPVFRHRPAHADLLHVDLWWKDQPVSVDAGTYAYRAAPPLADAFKSTAFHNTVEVDGISQMEPVGRFMLLPWAKARLVGRGLTPNKTARWMLLESEAYDRLSDPVRHRRMLIAADGFVAVIDRLRGKRAHLCRLHWLLDGELKIQEDECNPSGLLKLKNGDLNLQWSTSGEPTHFSVATGDGSSARGWRSSRYMEKTAVPSLSMERWGRDIVFVSVFSEEKLQCKLETASAKLSIAGLVVDCSGGTGSISIL